jgi:hypothetical protein
MKKTGSRKSRVRLPLSPTDLANPLDNVDIGSCGTLVFNSNPGGIIKVH